MFDQATKHFQLAIEFNEENAQAHFRLGVRLYEQEEIKNAEEHLKKAISLDSQNAQALYLAMIFREDDDPNLAKKHF